MGEHIGIQQPPGAARNPNTAASRLTRVPPQHWRGFAVEIMEILGGDGTGWMSWGQGCSDSSPSWPFAGTDFLPILFPWEVLCPQKIRTCKILSHRGTLSLKSWSRPVTVDHLCTS